MLIFLGKKKNCRYKLTKAPHINQNFFVIEKKEPKREKAVKVIKFYSFTNYFSALSSR